MTPPIPDPETLFKLGNGLALSAWLALAVSPAGARWTPTARRYAGRVVPLLLAVAYVIVFATHGMGDGGYSTLGAVQRLLAQPTLLVAGWLHYLAFDLFVGTWVAEQAAAAGMPHLMALPLLLLCFLFGPAGLLAFAVLRLAYRQGLPSALTA